MRFQTEPPPAGEKVQAARRRPKEFCAFLYARRRSCALTLSTTFALRLRLARRPLCAGASLRLSPGHGSCDPPSWQGRLGRYPVGRIFSCYVVGRKRFPHLVEHGNGENIPIAQILLSVCIGTIFQFRGIDNNSSHPVFHTFFDLTTGKLKVPLIGRA